jgi:hypothetical protein
MPDSRNRPVSRMPSLNDVGLQLGGKSPRTYHKIGRQHAFDPAIEVRDESDESLFPVRMAAKLTVQRIKEDRLS